MAAKKDIETIAENVESAVETAEKEVKKAVKKAAPKAAEAAEQVEKAVKKTAAKAADKAADVAEKAEKAVKKAAPKAAEAADKAEKAVKKAAETVSEAAAGTAVKAAKAVEAAADTVKAAAQKAEKKAEAAKPAAKKGKESAAPKAFSSAPRLKKRYFDEIAPSLKEKFGYANVMQIPRLEKVIINMGLGSDKDNPKGIEAAVKELSTIAGQKAVVTRAKKSVANFKVRQGMTIGAKVTLRGDRMYYFVDKLMNIVLPRVRDFRGVSDKAFDGRGNYALGLKEQLIFPEINYDDIDKVRGMNVVFVTSAASDEECKELLTQLGMPFVQG